jgi:hypothetical protein
MLVLILYSSFEKYIGYGMGASHCLNRVIETNPSVSRSLVSSAPFKSGTLIDLMFKRYVEV